MSNFESGGYSSAIATAILLAIAVGHSDTASAATITVTNCNDNGSGSLRSAVFRAASGDTIDLAHLACSRIVLTSGQIVINQQNLKLVGRSRDALTIDGNLSDRVLFHTWRDTGRLRLEHLSVARGFRTQADDPGSNLTVGGCIRADSDLDLYRTRIHHCTVEPGNGGGMFVFGDASVSHALFLSNVARGDEEFVGAGGGLYVRQHLILDHSRVSTNQATAGGGVIAGNPELRYSLIDHNRGTGVLSFRGPASIIKSTIADNDGGDDGPGGLEIFNLDNTPGSLIAHSTISRNRSAFKSAVDIYGDATVVNSTVAFNRESKEGVPSCGGALAFRGVLHLESTIVASNLCAGTHTLDLAGTENASVIGSHNLIGKYNLPVPADTLSLSPRLETLANNGGPTPTDALLCGSPAIDRGNNVLRFAYDQRGPGYARVAGARTDIGAFELQNPSICGASP